jgi:hypothetical protein
MVPVPVPYREAQFIIGSYRDFHAGFRRNNLADQADQADHGE